MEATTGFEPVNRGFADLHRRVGNVGLTVRIRTNHHSAALPSACGSAIRPSTIHRVAPTAPVPSHAPHGPSLMPYKDPDQRRRVKREWQARWRLAHPQENAARVRDHYRRNPDKGIARGSVCRAVQTGRLVRLPCVECGSARSQAHHHNGYDSLHALDVVWLCSLHHAAAHGPHGFVTARTVQRA